VELTLESWPVRGLKLNAWEPWNETVITNGWTVNLFVNNMAGRRGGIRACSAYHSRKTFEILLTPRQVLAPTVLSKRGGSAAFSNLRQCLTFQYRIQGT
jgi:hypothetical protein